MNKKFLILLIVIILIALSSNKITTVVNEDFGQIGFFRNIYYIDQGEILGVSKLLYGDKSLLYTTSRVGMFKDIKVTAVSENYSIFHTSNILYGSFSPDKDDIVISEDVAYNYFGEYNVVGCLYTINGKNYTISGVIKNKNKIVFINLKDNTFNYEYGKIEIYKSMGQIGSSYYEKWFNYDEKIDILQIGKIQSQHFYFITLPLMIGLLVHISKLFIRTNVYIYRKYKESLKNHYTLQNLKHIGLVYFKHVFLSVVYFIIILLITIYLVRDVFIDERFIPSQLYSLTNILSTFDIYLQSLIQPSYLKYIFDDYLLVLYLNRLLGIIGVVVSLLSIQYFYKIK